MKISNQKHTNTTQSFRFKHVLPVLSALVLVCPLLVFAQDLQPQAERTSYTNIHADYQTYDAMQARIKGLNDRGIRVDDYHLSKAQCWLDTSYHEYTRNDRGGYPQAALSEAATLIEALQKGEKPGWETPLVNGAEKLRPDLWARYDALKASKGFSCAAQATACAEVELVHAGNEIHDGGWRHAKPYIQIAEDLVSRAERQAQVCGPTPSPAPQVENFELSADALFDFDRGDLDGLLPAGRAELNNLAERLERSYAQIDAIRIVGHTDRLGSDMYNQRLSEQRASTIKGYLQSRGMSAPIHALGVGERQPTALTSVCIGERATLELKACLQPDRRVGVQITGTKRVTR
jgi:OmpA-OmpF porin, OOP family